MFLSVIVFILILSFLVVSHEFGHFITAKKSGVKVEEFGLGYPPRLFGWKKGETVYSINAIPFGGFVRLYGEDEEDEEYLSHPRSFSSKSKWKRALIVSAGVIMNFLVAVIIFYFLLPFNGFSSQQYLIFNYHFPFGQQENFPLVSFVAKNSPAEKNSLKRKDIILEGALTLKSLKTGEGAVHFKSAEDLIKFVNKNKGKKIFLKVGVLGSKKVRELSLVPRASPPKREGPMGVALGTVAEIKYNTPFEKITSGFLHSLNLSHYSIVAFGHLIKSSFKEESLKPLSAGVVGPVGILAVTKLTLKSGLLAILNLTALFSLALAIMNMLPFPALDGGRLLFIIGEAIFQRRISPSLERKINFVGFIILILFLVAVTYKDINQFKGILF